jgi:hypothetical protein
MNSNGFFFKKKPSSGILLRHINPEIAQGTLKKRVAGMECGLYSSGAGLDFLRLCFALFGGASGAGSIVGSQ